MTRRQNRRPGKASGRPASLTWPLPWIAAIAVTAVIIGGALLWFIPEKEAPRARQYTAFKSCLLTNFKGINENPASAVWKGMQQASLKTHSKVQYLVNTEVKSTNAVPYLGTLLQTRCNLIIAVGDV